MKENPRSFPKEPAPKETGAPFCRWRLTVRGIVQGVGFRPFVYNTARGLGLAGWVKNTSGQVDILVEGPQRQLESFVESIRTKCPAQARIDALEVVEQAVAPPPLGDFQIIASTAEEAVRPIIPADLALCDACRAEIHTPTERRYRYPFTNCTHCGPRWSIIRGTPYDRPRTSMAHFAMCPACQAEYENPADRRFHAQPIACPRCGPKLRLLVRAERQRPPINQQAASPTGQQDAPPIGQQEGSSTNYIPAAEGDEALQQAAQAILEGKIVALKGLGGFQLLCDAACEEVVQELRRRKRRPDKPFALMFPNLEQVRQTCLVSESEAHLLQSPEAPIVLLRRRPSPNPIDQPAETTRLSPPRERPSEPKAKPGEGDWTAARAGMTSKGGLQDADVPCWRIASAVAPGNPYLGVMLPYTPLHELLMEAVGRPIVCTSGNLSEEPMAYRTTEAISRLGRIADLVLTHNRPIVRPVDDSVVRVQALPPEEPSSLPFASLTRPAKGRPASPTEERGIGPPHPAWLSPGHPLPRRGEGWCPSHPASPSAQPASPAVGRCELCQALAASPGQKEVSDSPPAGITGTGKVLVQVLRRARGYAPRPIELGFQTPTILALGGHLKNTVGLSLGSQVVLSQHVGDLDNLPSLEVFHRTVEDLLQFFRVEPELLACDLHPDYASTQYAEELARRLEVPLLRVQHHEAHLAACLAEQGLTPKELAEPILGFSWDGTGYGWDGAIWGGEMLLWRGGRVERVGSLWPFPLPGGDQAVREPRRSALGVLYELLSENAWEKFPLLKEWFSPMEQTGLRSMLHRGVNSPRTSSMGRLFDAAAALCELGQRISFEGQAAMSLEFAALEEPAPLTPRRRQDIGNPAETPSQPAEATEAEAHLSAYPLPWIEGNEKIERAEKPDLPAKIAGTSPEEKSLRFGLWDWRPMVEAVLKDRLAGVSVGEISRRFHAALADGVLKAAQWAAAHWGVRRAALSGGCFQNSLLTQLAYQRLRQAGFTVFLHQHVPPGDGGVALGQIMLAAALSQSKQ